MLWENSQDFLSCWSPHCHFSFKSPDFSALYQYSSIPQLYSRRMQKQVSLSSQHNWPCRSHCKGHWCLPGRRGAWCSLPHSIPQPFLAGAHPAWGTLWENPSLPCITVQGIACVSYGSSCSYLFILKSSKLSPVTQFYATQGPKESGWGGWSNEREVFTSPTDVGVRTNWTFGNTTLASYTQNENRKRKCLY